MRKDIPNYERLYQVDEKGNIYSVKRKIQLKPSTSRSGYLQITLSKNNKSRCFFIHQLVVITFIDSNYLSKGLVVDHIDNDKLNNNVSNLRVVTTRENKSKDRNENKYSKLTGVSKYKNGGKYVATIRIKGKLKYLGTFDNEKDASKVYQKELTKVVP